MNIVTLTLGAFHTHTYVVIDETSSGALLIDPVDADGADRAIDEVEQRGRHIIGIVCTHAHFDHIGGVARAKERLGVPFAIGEHALDSLRTEPDRAWTVEGIHIPAPPEPDRLLREGENVQLGALRFDVLFTAGHWRGDIGLHERREEIVFSGDALFRGEIGRFNEGCDIPTLIQSIKTKLFSLPDETVLFPGHGLITTVGYERKYNPSLKS